MMWKRKLGKGGLEVSALSLGCMGFGFVPYSPLGKGFLTGTIDVSTTFDPSDFRNNLPRFTPNALTANQGVVELLRSIGKRHGATPEQIALAWLLAQEPWIVPLF